ncbi:hypothetical protein [Candidatus Pelagibacter bacterium nBUS_32]|uniref:hypothetical protein n=1 Tax=Candidatus Pelagibacter bacterium nBUS_32 TaxID=3374192 RepID=UPI003EB6B8BE
MQKSKKLFIHLGIHHTGTTFLQKEIFPNFDDELSKYHGKHYFKNNNYEVNKNLYYLSLKNFKGPYLSHKKKLFSSESILKSHILDKDVLRKNLEKLRSDYNLKLLITIREPFQIIAIRLVKINKIFNLENINKINCYYPYCKKKIKTFIETQKFIKCNCGKSLCVNPIIYSKKFLTNYFAGFNFKIFNVLYEKNNDTTIDRNQIIEILKFIEIDSKKIKEIIDKTSNSFSKKINHTLVDKSSFIEPINKKIKSLYPGYF